VSGRRAFLAVATLAGISLASCGGDDSGPAPTTTASPTAQPVRDIDLGAIAPELLVRYPPGVVQQGWPEITTSGDFNGDHVVDLLLGAPFADGPDGSRPDAGEAYVLFGPLSGEIDLAAPGSAGVVVLGAEVADNLGGGVAAGDLNGDGLDDLIIGAPASNGLVDVRTDMGEVYVIFGRSDLAGTIDILEEAQDVTIQPAEGFATLGRTFAVGDLNGDGTADLVAGAPYGGREANTPPGGPRTTVGEVYVFYGGADLSGLLTVARNQDDFRLAGDHEFDTFGGDVAVADANGDGQLDIVVGANGYDGGGGANGESGAVFVFFGSLDPPDVRKASQADIVLSGPAEYRLGTSVAAPDLDGDGVPEIAASAPSAPDESGAQPGAGRLYYVRKPASGPGPIDVEACQCSSVLYGVAVGESFSATVESSDDRRWLSLGSPSASAEGRAGSGVVYLLRSAAAGAATGDPAIRVLGASPGEGLGGTVSFTDLDGDGLVELLALAIASGGSAAATLYAVSLDD